MLKNGFLLGGPGPYDRVNERLSQEGEWPLNGEAEMREGTESIDFDSSIPYYSQLKRILLDQIYAGSSLPGEPLPTQSELCQKYRVSMSVVRQAMREMELEGAIVQRKGKPAHVAESKISGRLLERLSGTYQDLTELGFSPVSEILRQEVNAADDDIAARLEVAPGTEVIEIERLRKVNDEPFVIITSYLPYSLCPRVSEIDLTDKSLLAVLELEYGIVIASSKRSIETASANEAEARLLQIKKGSPLMLFNSVSYSEGGSVIGTTRALFRGDRARFDVELVRFRNRD